MELSNQTPYPPTVAFENQEVAGNNLLQMTQETNVIFPISKIVAGGKEYIYLIRADGGLDLQQGYSGEYVPPTGQFTYHHGLLFPQKGHVYPEALNSVNTIKRIIISAIRILSSRELVLSWIGFMVLPWRFKHRLLHRSLHQLDQLASPLLAPHFLLDNYAMKPALGMKQFVSSFIIGLGFAEHKALKTGKILSTIIEYDNAYCERMQDIANECVKEDLIRNPYQEISRLYQIFVSREVGIKLKLNVKGTLKLLRWALFIPRVRRAFKRAVMQTNFDDLKMTKADRYSVLFHNGYNFFGMSYEERQAELSKLHGGKIPIGTPIRGSKA